MAGMGDGVQNLEAFIALLGQTTSELHDQTTEVETAQVELDRLTDEADDGLGALADVLEEGTDELGDEADRATSALADVEARAEDVAQARLAELAGALADGAEGGEERAATARERLDEAFDALKTEGVGAFVDVLHQLAGEADEARGEAEQEFGDLGDAVAEAAAALRQAQEDASGALDDAASAVSREADEVASAGQQTVAAWSAAREQLENEASDAESSLGDAYSEWTEHMQQEGQSAVEAVRAALSAAVEGATTDSASLLNEALQTAVDEALPELAEESGEVLAAVEPGEPLAQALEPMLTELVVVQSVVDQIAKLLQEIGNG
ncbi:MAG: hypothetical protein ABW221_19315 [Vicinamibacteria bacterium]